MEFKGTKGEVYRIIFDVYTKEGSRNVGRFYDGKDTSFDDMDYNIAHANAKLFMDALNVRKQINCSLIELLEKYNGQADIVRSLLDEKDSLQVNILKDLIEDFQQINGANYCIENLKERIDIIENGI